MSETLGAGDIVAQHIRGAEAFETTNNGGVFAPIPEEKDEVSSSGSTIHGEEKGSPESGPTDMAEAERPGYAARRTVTGKSSTSVRTNTDVDALVRILSRRTTARSHTDGTEDGEGEGYEHDLEDIMSGIFGSADDDVSKRKNVGVIWKHLTVPCLPEFALRVG